MNKFWYTLVFVVVCVASVSCGDDDNDNYDFTSESLYDSTIKVSIDRFVKLSHSAACNFKVEGAVEGFYVLAFTDEAYKTYDFSGKTTKTMKDGVYFSKDEFDYTYTISSLDSESKYWIYIVPVNAKGTTSDAHGRCMKLFTTVKDYDQPEVDIEGVSVEQNNTVWNYKITKNSFARTFYVVHSEENFNNNLAHVALIMDAKIENNSITADKDDGIYNIKTSTSVPVLNIFVWAKRTSMSGIVNSLQMNSRYYAPPINKSIDKPSAPVASKCPPVNDLTIKAVIM